MCLLRYRLRGDLTELIVHAFRGASAAIALFALTCGIAAAATATPKPTPHPVMTTFKKTYKAVLPTRALRSSYVVEVNKLGQISRVRSVDPSKNPGFDAMTYGNSLQAFVRTADGTAIAGVYKLIYDYSPQTKKIRRDVQLIQAGGVNPDAPGAVTVEVEKDMKRQAAAAAKKSQDKANAKLPDFSQIAPGSPAPSPK